ncbi:hypothetical protein [Streptomyces inhibens]|uniref:hypothetical protein n=1 Tax=Streptomyces inhibens TaxID=2293571 RepID=UPI001EE6C9E7|nr:hypothetical protein [Streptomyces inhibens]UKY49867.1 hypothetical protein KI385_14260 [Streptomyces inhibens]
MDRDLPQVGDFAFGEVAEPDVLFGRGGEDVRQFVVLEVEPLVEERLECGVTGEGVAGEVDRGNVEVPVRAWAGMGDRISG